MTAGVIRGWETYIGANFCLIFGEEIQQAGEIAKLKVNQYCLPQLIIRLNSFTTAARSSGHNSVTTGARYSGQTILIICNVDKQIAENMRTCLPDPDILLPEVGHLSGYFVLKW